MASILDLTGKVSNQAGTPKVSLTIELWEASNWELNQARTDSTTTDSDGNWAFSSQDDSKDWIVVVIDGNKKFLLDGRNKMQLGALGIRGNLELQANLVIQNVAATFDYTIRAGAITANRVLDLPLITGTDTLVALGIAQAFLANQSFEGSLASANGPIVAFQHTRSGTPSSHTIVQNGDEVGRLDFAGSNGTDYNDQAAHIIGSIDGTPGVSGDMPGRLAFHTSADGSGSPTERMRINKSGGVSIGAALDPTVSTLLDLHSTTQALLLPRMTETQRDALTAINGMMIYNTSSSPPAINGYEDGGWLNL